MMSSQEPNHEQFHYQQVKAIKIRVFEWKEGIMNKEFSDCGLLQCRVINETMHVKKRNQDFLEASRECNAVNIEPLMETLPYSYESSYQTWNHMFFRLLAVNGQGLLDAETSMILSGVVSEYLVSNYHAVQDNRDYKIVVALNVYMKTIIDESSDIGSNFSFGPKETTGELLSRNYGLKKGKIIGSIDDCLFEREEKVGFFKEFFENDGNSLLNLLPSSEDEEMIVDCIVRWLVEEPNRLRPNGEGPDTWIMEVPPALTIKKYDAGCSKNSEENCAICLEEFRVGDSVVVTPCSHIFHCNSILGWLTENSTCPICRTVCHVHI